MNRRSFLAAAVAALAGSTVAKGAVLPLTLPDTPVELAKQAGMAVPPAAAEPAKVFFWGTKGVHPALLDDSRLRLMNDVWSKYAQELALRFDMEVWGNAFREASSGRRISPSKVQLASFPVRKFTH